MFNGWILNIDRHLDLDQYNDPYGPDLTPTTQTRPLRPRPDPYDPDLTPMT